MRRVGVAQGTDRYDTVTEALRLVASDIPPKQIQDRSVLIKPNLVSMTERLAITHVDAVRAVIDFVEPFRPKRIFIAEGTGDTPKAFRNFGYDELEREYTSVELIDVNTDRQEHLTLMTMTGEEHTVKVSKAALDAEFIFSVARAKTHDHVGCTLSLKNMQGCLVRPDQVWAHGAEREPEEDIVRSNCLLSRNLVTIAQQIRPDVAVIDGIVAMEGDGPGGGERVDLRVVVAGSDFVSADAVMAEIMGFDSREIGYIWYADKVGLGVGRREEIEVVGRRIEEARRTFKPHSNYYREQVGWREYAKEMMGLTE